MHSNSISQHKDIWYSASKKRFDGREPFFYNINAPWVDTLEAEWLAIRDELNNLLQTQANCLTPYFNETMISKPELWKVFPFFFWKRKRGKLSKMSENYKIVRINSLYGIRFF